MIEPKLPNAVRRTPMTTLRDWLDHLAANDQLAVTRPGVGLRQPPSLKRPYHATWSDIGPRIETLAGNSGVVFPERRKAGRRRLTSSSTTRASNRASGAVGKSN
jgi:hypothetical protein